MRWPWLVIVLAGALYEGVMLAVAPDATLSAVVWDVLALHPLVWFAGLGLFAWAGFHWFQRTWRKP